MSAFCTEVNVLALSLITPLKIAKLEVVTMVFFTCDACGESLKKAQVEKHYKFKCRSCSVLTCVDCQKVGAV